MTVREANDAVLERVCDVYNCRNCPMEKFCDEGKNDFQILWEFDKWKEKNSK